MNRPRRLSLSTALWVVTGMLAVAAVGAMFVRPTSVVSLVEKLYSARGSVSEEGRRLILATWKRGIRALVGATFAAAVAAYVTRMAERAAAAAAARGVAEEESDSTWPRWAYALVGVGVVTRAVLGFRHLSDSMSYDEISTIQLYAPLSVVEQLGFGHHTFVPNHHLLNSLMVKLSMGLGWHSEIGLRIWAYLASLALIPAMMLLCRAARVGALATTAAVALAATSMTVDRFGALARGYSFTILAAALSLAIYLRLLDRFTGRRAFALIVVNTLLVLANIYAVLLVIAEIAYLYVAVLFARSPDRPAVPFEKLAWTLMGSILAGFGLQALLLPHILLGSLVFAAGQVRLAPLFVKLVAAPTDPHGGTLAAVVWSAIALAGLRFRNPRSRHAHAAMWMTVAVGILTCIVTHQVYLRTLAYLSPATILLVALTLDGLVESAQKPALVAVFATAAVTAFLSFRREPLSDLRAMTQKSRELAGTTQRWTAGYASPTIGYYEPGVRTVELPAELPETESWFLKAARVDAVPIQRFIESRCVKVFAPACEEEQAIFHCR